MTRHFEDWQLDMLLGGDGTPEMEAILASSSADQARLAELQHNEQNLISSLFRVECPTSLSLGELQLNLLDHKASNAIHAHLNLCPHCTQEVAMLAEMVTQPVFQSLPSNPFAQKRDSILKRIIMSVQRLVGDMSAPSELVRVRGKSWNGYYEGEDYMLSLTRQQNERGSALEGSIFGPSVGGYATLKEHSGITYQGAINENGAFSFDGVASGDYELIITTPQVELVVPELDFDA